MEHHHFFIGKSTISMAIFSYVSLPEGNVSLISWRFPCRCKGWPPPLRLCQEANLLPSSPVADIDA
jgi:hypothetical protein